MVCHVLEKRIWKKNGKAWSGERVIENFYFVSDILFEWSNIFNAFSVLVIMALIREGQVMYISKKSYYSLPQLESFEYLTCKQGTHMTFLVWNKRLTIGFILLRLAKGNGFWSDL